MITIVAIISATVIANAQKTSSGPDAEPEKSYKRLLELKESLEKIPFDGQETEPHKSFLKKHENDIVYSDPAGQYFVRSERFWELSEKYKTHPMADEIAWTAAQNPLPGECEGDLNCYAYFVRITAGQYLEKFPKGKNANDALADIGQYLDLLESERKKPTGYDWPNDSSSRADLRKIMDELRSIVGKTSADRSRATLRQIGRVRSFFR